jgi:hypothetical protein
VPFHVVNTSPSAHDSGSISADLHHDTSSSTSDTSSSSSIGSSLSSMFQSATNSLQAFGASISESLPHSPAASSSPAAVEAKWPEAKDVLAPQVVIATRSEMDDDRSLHDASAKQNETEASHRESVQGTFGEVAQNVKAKLSQAENDVELLLEKAAGEVKSSAHRISNIVSHHTEQATPKTVSHHTEQATPNTSEGPIIATQAHQNALEVAKIVYDAHPHALPEKEDEPRVEASEKRIEPGSLVQNKIPTLMDHSNEKNVALIHMRTAPKNS